MPVALYLDEDVPLAVAVIGRRHGLDVTHTQEYGRKGADDPDQLRFAAEQGRILVTRNCDDFRPFSRSFAEQGLPHRGVLCISQSLQQRSPAEIVKSLLSYVTMYPNGIPMYMIDYLHPVAG